MPTLADALGLTEDARVVTTAEPPYTIVHTNTAWSKVTGYCFHEVFGKTCAFLQGAATQKHSLDQLRAALQSKKPFEVSMINYTRDGTPFVNNLSGELVEGGTHIVATVRAHPIPANGSTVVPAVARETAELAREPLTPVNYADPANYERAAKRVKRGHEKVRLAEVMANSVDPIVVCAKEYPHVILHPNQPWLEMCGYSLEEVQGLTNKILTGPETDPAAIDALLNCVRRNETSTQTLVNYKKGGQRFVNQVQTMAVYDEHDEVTAFMSMLSEVSEDSVDDAPDGCLNPADRHLWNALQCRLTFSQKATDADARDGVRVNGGGAARVEAAAKLITNHDAVLADATSATPASQPNLARVPASAGVAYVDQAMRDVAKRLLGDGAAGLLQERLDDKHPLYATQGAAWARAVAFLRERVQSTVLASGRAADMSPAAASAFRSACLEVAELVKAR